jgi:iron complex outermembrane receptor protein
MAGSNHMLSLAGVSLALAMAMAAAPASAQPSTTTPDEPLENASTAASQSDETIVITGSRIRRNPLDQDQPVTFLDQADIARTGLTSAADVLQRLPSSGGALNSRFNNSGNFGNPPDGGGVGAGAAEVDLRYLGSKRVLVLVDGIRYVNGASASGVPGATDLNSIPESMIERIEVLQDGASAIYGSDAIAGVVNIITKKKQDGLLLSAQLGVNKEGDGFTRNLQASYGLSMGGGATSLVVGGNWVKQDGISSAGREISLFPTPGADSCLAGGCSSGTPTGRFIYSAFGPPGGFTLIAPVIGRSPTPADYRPWAGASDAFNFAPYNFIQTPLERYGVFANLRQELGDVAAFSLKAVWNRRNSKNQAAPLPLFVGPDAGNGNLLDTITIHSTNPFNPYGVTLDSSNLSFIGRRVVEGGPRRYNQQVKTFYVTATVDGKFQVGGRDWYWDVNGAYGRNKAEQTVFGNINADNLAKALGPVAACIAPCVPFNIFGGAGSITQAQYDYVAFVQDDSSLQTQWDFTANLTGELFSLPGGPVGFAIGLEHRDQNGRFDPDEVVRKGLGSDIPALPTIGGYTVKEAYAEVRLPLLRDTAFFNRLELTGAARYSDYSRSGSTTTFKAGVNWKPIEDLLLRGSWSEGFRAPSIGEFFGTPSRFDQEIVDPCSAVNGAIPAAVRANCIAAGVPANGSYVQANPQLPVITGGSLTLEPETSESWGAGAVWSPGFVPRLSLEANYFDIKLDGAIQAIDAEVLLGRCAENADAFSCAAITRSASGAVTQIRGLLQNIAGIETDGLDVTLNYRTGETGLGRFGLYWTNTFLFHYKVIVPSTDGVTVIDREGTEQGSPDQAFPKWKSTAVLDWTMKDGFGASLTGRYIKGVDEANGNHLDSRLYADLQLRWEPDNWDGFGFALGANNLFDSDPPPCFTCGLNNLDPTTYDVPGTFFYAKVSWKM